MNGYRPDTMTWLRARRMRRHANRVLDRIRAGQGYGGKFDIDTLLRWTGDID